MRRADGQGSSIDKMELPTPPRARGAAHTRSRDPCAAMHLDAIEASHFAQRIAKTVVNERMRAIGALHPAIMILGPDRQQLPGVDTRACEQRR